MLVTPPGAFARQQPAIRVSIETGDIETGDRLVDLRCEPVDIAIGHGLGKYPGLEAKFLCAPELILVASPALSQQHGPLKSAADCLRYTLAPDATGRDWGLWFGAQGSDVHEARCGSEYHDDFLCVKAAVEGQGLALLNDVYVGEALDGVWPRAFAYCAVALRETFGRPALQALVNWLRASLR